jgi:hypothetical protein
MKVETIYRIGIKDFVDPQTIIFMGSYFDKWEKVDKAPPATNRAGRRRKRK